MAHYSQQYGFRCLGKGIPWVEVVQCNGPPNHQQMTSGRQVHDIFLLLILNYKDMIQLGFLSPTQQLETHITNILMPTFIQKSLHALKLYTHVQLGVFLNYQNTCEAQSLQDHNSHLYAKNIKIFSQTFENESHHIPCCSHERLEKKLT